MVNKTLFSLSVILIFLTSSIVIAKEQTTIKTEYPQIAMFNRDGVLYSGYGINYRRTRQICGDGTISSREECEPPDDNNVITNRALKSTCKTILINAPDKEFNVSKSELDLENPICDSTCLCNAKLKPKQAMRPVPVTARCGNNKVESNEECDPPTTGHITNSAQKSSCVDRLRTANWDPGVNPDDIDIENPVCLAPDCICSAYNKGVKVPSSGTTAECIDEEEARIRAEIQKIISKVNVGGPKSNERKEICAKQQMYKDMIARLIEESKCPDIDAAEYHAEIDRLCSNFPLVGGTSGQKPSGWSKAGGVIVDGVKQILPWKWLRKGLKGVGIGGCGLIMSSPTCAYPGDDCVVQEVGDILGGPITWGGGLVEGLIRKVNGKCNDKCECIGKDGYNDDLDEAIKEAIK